MCVGGGDACVGGKGSQDGSHTKAHPMDELCMHAQESTIAQMGLCHPEEAYSGN